LPRDPLPSAEGGFGDRLRHFWGNVRPKRAGRAELRIRHTPTAARPPCVDIALGRRGAIDSIPFGERPADPRFGRRLFNFSRLIHLGGAFTIRRSGHTSGQDVWRHPCSCRDNTRAPAIVEEGTEKAIIASNTPWLVWVGTRLRRDGPRGRVSVIAAENSAQGRAVAGLD